MKFTAEQAWYTKHTRRPALIRRSTLLSLHSIVGAKQSSVNIRSPKHVSYRLCNNKHDVALPISFDPPKTDVVGKIHQIDGTVELLPGETILSEYCTIQVNGNTYGLEIDDGKVLAICLGPVDREPFAVKDFLIIRPGDIENHPSGEWFVTTYGRYLCNYFLLASTVCSRYTIPELKFVNDTWPFGKIERRLGELLMDDRIDVPVIDEYIDNGYFLSSIGEICGTVMTRKSIVPNPKAIELRNQLLKKHAHELNDPRIMTIIENEIIAADKEYMKGDPSMDFLGDTAKKFGVHRKRKNLAVGMLEEFGESRGKYTFVARSLVEGWKPEDIPALMDESRRGFYDRAKETEVAGLDTKWMISVFQDCKITQDNCGTTELLPVTLTRETAGGYLGQNVYTGKKVNSKPINFPASEIPVLQEQDVFHTTRILKDRDAYKVNDIVLTPWGKTYRVVFKNDYTTLDEHPFLSSLTEEQKATIGDHPYSIFRLARIATVDGFEPLTEDNLDQYLNKPIKIRSMMYCKPEDGRYCMVCAGNKFATMNYVNIGAQPIDFGAVMLTMSMKSMHGVKMDTFKLDNIDDYVLNP